MVSLWSSTRCTEHRRLRRRVAGYRFTSLGIAHWPIFPRVRNSRFGKIVGGITEHSATLLPGCFLSACHTEALCMALGRAGVDRQSRHLRVHSFRHTINTIRASSSQDHDPAKIRAILGWMGRGDPGQLHPLEPRPSEGVSGYRRFDLGAMICPYPG